MTREVEWQVFDVTASPDQASLVTEVACFVSNHPEASIDHDPRWLLIRAESIGKSAKIFFCRDVNGTIVGVAPMLVHPSSLDFEVMGKSLLEVRTRRFSLTRGPLFAPEYAVSHEPVIALLRSLRKSLTGAAVGFVLGTDLSWPLGRLLATRAFSIEGFLILGGSAAYQRRLILLPASFEEYLQQLGTKTRQHLRREERRLSKKSGDTLDCRVYVGPDDVDAFLGHAMEVSKKTYQWHLLRAGVSNDAENKRVLTAAAGAGWFRSYVLLCKGQPLAFVLGYVYGGTYIYEKIGYDPEWADWAVGNVLHLGVVRDLLENAPGVKRFDFLYGDNSSKQRLSNAARTERNFHLVPATPRWFVFVCCLRTFNAIAARLGDALDRWDLRVRLRRVIRRFSTQTNRG
jgi:hypothetical protein